MPKLKIWKYHVWNFKNLWMPLNMNMWVLKLIALTKCYHFKCFGLNEQNLFLVENQPNKQIIKICLQFLQQNASWPKSVDSPLSDSIYSTLK